MKEKQKRREQLVVEVIEKGINLQAEDKLNEWSFMLSRHQKENLLISYRKIKKKASDKLPEIAQNVKDLLNSSSILNETSLQAKQAKEDIAKTMRDIERLFIAIDNIISNENSAIKNKISSHLKSFLQNEKILNTSILQINLLHDKKEGLKIIKNELESLKKDFETADQISSNQLETIQNHLNRLNEINKNHNFDSIVAEHKKIDDQLKKIQSHNDFANKLQELLKTTFFSNNLIFNLVKAQKEYLLNSNSDSKEEALANNRNKINDFLKQLESFGFSQDMQEIRLKVRKILDGQHPRQLDEEYNDTLLSIRKIISKHRSLNQEEQEVLSKYIDKSKVLINTQLKELPDMLQENQAELINLAQTLNSTVEKMQKSLDDIEKQSFTDDIDIFTIGKILSSIAFFGAGYLGYISKTLSYVFGSSIALGSSAFVRGGKMIANSFALPLAKSSVDNAYSVITNQPFYEGLIHAYMRKFIDHVKNTKGSL